MSVEKDFDPIADQLASLLVQIEGLFIQIAQKGSPREQEEAQRGLRTIAEDKNARLQKMIDGRFNLLYDIKRSLKLLRLLARNVFLVWPAGSASKRLLLERFEQMFKQVLPPILVELQQSAPDNFWLFNWNWADITAAQVSPARRR